MRRRRPDPGATVEVCSAAMSELVISALARRAAQRAREASRLLEDAPAPKGRQRGSRAAQSMERYLIRKDIFPD